MENGETCGTHHLSGLTPCSPTYRSYNAVMGFSSEFSAFACRVRSYSRGFTTTEGLPISVVFRLQRHEKGAYYVHKHALRTQPAQTITPPVSRKIRPEMLSKTRCPSVCAQASARHTACVPRPARTPAGRRSSIASRAAQPEEQPTQQAEAAAPVVLRDMQVSWDKFLQVRGPQQVASGLRTPGALAHRCCSSSSS